MKLPRAPALSVVVLLLSSACGGGGGGRGGPLATPAGVTVASEDSGQVTLSWNSLSGATSYNLYWSTSPVVTTSTGIPIPGVSSPYFHSGRADGTTYFYVVTALKGARESVESAEVFAMPQASPTGITATSGGLEVTLNWGRHRGPHPTTFTGIPLPE